MPATQAGIFPSDFALVGRCPAEIRFSTSSLGLEEGLRSPEGKAKVDTQECRDVKSVVSVQVQVILSMIPSSESGDLLRRSPRVMSVAI